MKAKTSTIMGQLAGLVLGTSFALSAFAGTPNFTAQQTFAIGSAPTWGTSADLNGDGMADLIVTNWNDGTVSILMNTAAPGDSVPNYAPQQILDVGAAPTFVTTADLNGDGKPDLIILSYNTGTMTVFINDTAPNATQASFEPAQTFAVGDFPEMVRAADINGDGVPDLVVSDYGDYAIAVLLNTTATNATAVSFALTQTIPVMGGPYAMQVLDLNGDGRPDIVVTEMDGQAVSILLNTTVAAPADTATVSFAPQQDYPVGADPTSVVVVDLNGDALPDLAVTNEGDNTLSVLFNSGSAGAPDFAAQQVIAVGNAPVKVMAVDVDNDGSPDLLVLNFDDADVMALMNSTTPSASALAFSPQYLAVGDQPVTLMTMDQNGDGKPDVTTVNSGDNTVSVLLNQSY